VTRFCNGEGQSEWWGFLFSTEASGSCGSLRNESIQFAESSLSALIKKSCSIQETSSLQIWLRNLERKMGEGKSSNARFGACFPPPIKDRRGQKERRAQQREQQVGGISGLVYASSPGCTMKKTISKKR
jgi:hypothetical protein